MPTSPNVLTTSGHRASSLTASSPPALAVLDTNVVLDLLVFGNIRAQALAQSLAQRQILWLATEPMLAELADVVSRSALARWCPDPAAVLTQARALCHLVVVCPTSCPRAPTCADPDDQIFIDLAWSWPVDCLFSRDRALLALAGAARQRGLSVVEPSQWPSRPAG